MKTVSIGKSSIEIFPLGLGTNTFNDPSNVDPFFAVLDGFAERGGNFIDTADMYSYWIEGNSGGESETIIGKWLKGRGRRDEFVIATKVSGMPGLKGLAPETIARGADDSLRRLQTDYIDLYYAHYEDDNTPIVESAAAFDKLVKAGKIRAIALSNQSPAVIDEWFKVSRENDFALPIALQPEYSLVARGYETELLAIARRHEMSVFPYLVLAGGFLTGKYRSEADTEGRDRGGIVKKYLTGEGLRLLDTLYEVAAAHGVESVAVAVAWTMADDKVTAPLAAATRPSQLDQLFAGVELELTKEQIAALDEASASFV